MTGLLQKHAADVVGYLRGADHFSPNPAAFDGWAYPLDLDFTLEREDLYFSPRDAEGLPVRRYRSAGLQYNPTRLAGFALAHFNRLGRDGAGESRSRFLQVADWFLRAEDGVWRYGFDWNDLKAPWASCMAQGEGMSVLVRAHHLTGEERYLRQARRAAAPFSLSLEEGGLRSRLPDGSPFLEEYPSREPAHVLNGFLYALLGLADLIRVAPEVRRERGVDALVDAVARNVDLWDLGYWTAYDLAVGPRGMRNAATVAYHQLHVSQATFLGRFFGRDELLDAARRWTAQKASPACRARALGAKLLYRVAVRAQR